MKLHGRARYRLELLQRQAALWIALPAPTALIEQLSAIHAEHGRHIDAGYLRGVHESNDRFHLTLYGACGNAHLVQPIELHMRLSVPVRANSMGDSASLRISHRHHAMMFDMLRGHDNWGSPSSASITCCRASSVIWSG